MDQAKKQLSCADCYVKNCIFQGRQRPVFCTSDRIDAEMKDMAFEEYKRPDTRRFMLTAAAVKGEGYKKWTRLRETVEFAKRMGYKKIGIATCISLLDESRKVASLLRDSGFDVICSACKVGTVCEKDVGIADEYTVEGRNMCNPILQAKYLNASGAEFFVVIGLCVGHDSLFYQYAERPVTTLFVKDRVLNNNPVAALENL